MPKQVRKVDSEKITINLGHVDLGRIDLLVDAGFYTNRTDFIRAAIRSQLGQHAGDVSALVERRVMEIGLRDLGRDELEAVRQAGEVLDIRVVGLLRLGEDISPELARATIGKLTVLGSLQGPHEVIAALKDRMG